MERFFSCGREHCSLFPSHLVLLDSRTRTATRHLIATKVSIPPLPFRFHSSPLLFLSPCISFFLYLSFSLSFYLPIYVPQPRLLLRALLLLRPSVRLPRARYLRGEWAGRIAQTHVRRQAWRSQSCTASRFYLRGVCVLCVAVLPLHVGNAARKYRF